MLFCFLFGSRLTQIVLSTERQNVLNFVPNFCEGHQGPVMSPSFAFGPFVLDAQRGLLLREGRPIAASSKGLQLLQALVSSPGRVLTKAELMQTAWGDAA